ncbi:LuxR C-terminal-related transcriptional regulator [Actinomadura roseirufa]|uniref:LuxR C-terminal-related transcriptional regulator n=1 Tax=Actinomadura roseirufa TaxID=2094049 RepID=UPI0013F17053|nr:LuxR family transcriptional regulator [Actinomadura roseirufa]
MDRLQEHRQVTDLLAGPDAPADPAASATRVLLVEGEAGIGRTHFLAEACQVAEHNGYVVAAGGPVELGPPAPMEPLLSALTGIVDVGETTAESWRQAWQVEQLRAAVEAKAHSTRVLVVLDDLQWADTALISALRVLPAQLVASPVCWILGRRRAAAGRALDQLFTLLRATGATQMTLPHFDDEAILGLCIDTLGAKPDRALRVLAGQAGGNPSLVVQLLKGLREEGSLAVGEGRACLTGSRLPERIRLLVKQWLDVLDSGTRHLLEVAAVVGATFHPRDAAELLGITPAELLPPLEAAVAAGLLEARGDDLAFRHDLVRRIVAAGIPGPVRQSLQVQIGWLLLERGARTTAAVALLMSGASPGDPHALAGLDVAAARMPAGASHITVDIAGRALELTDPTDRLHIPRVLAVLHALLAAGRPAEAVKLADAALCGNATGAIAAEMMIIQALALSPMGQASRAAETARAALDIAGLPEELRRRAELALLQAETLRSGNGDLRGRAQQIAVGDGSSGRPLTIAALILLARDAWDAACLTTALDSLEEAVKGTLGATLDAGQPHPSMILAMRLVQLRRLDEARRAMETVTGGLGSSGPAAWSPGLAIVRSWLHLAEGRPDEAIAEARTGLDEATAAGAHLLAAAARCALSAVALHRGDLENAAAALTEDRRAAERPPRDLGLADLVAAQVAEAREGPRAAVTALSDLFDSPRDYYRLLLSGPATPAWLTQTALAAGETSGAERIVAAAVDIARRNSTVPSVSTAAQHARGVLHADPEALRAAASGHTDAWARALASEDLALLLQHQGEEREQTVRALDEALSQYRAVGAARDTARVRSRLRRLGERRRHWENRRRPASGWAGLTGTEQRVSLLVAQGLTNQRIADRLFISVHTVAYHLRQVYRKLGIGSRVELTRLVTDSRDEPPR